ncbi:MAG: chloride channel protein [Lachnospiraceae bacterium]|nr:chloride channel protein [Lachnospiraceae bacterium]
MMNRKYIKKEIFRRRVKQDTIRALSTSKWIILSVIVGVISGFVSGSFGYLLNKVTTFRLDNPYMLFFLPLGSLSIVLLYKLIMKKKDPGTNLVLSAIHSDDEIPLRMAPLIYISTIITHAVGGSAGREGAALQLGGSIGNAIARTFGLSRKEDRHILIMCGMAAAFSGLFGTPIAAAVFAMEVVSVGIMHYAALLPCAIAALIARAIAANVFDLSGMSFEILNMPAFNLKSAVISSGIAILCGVVSIVFCVCLQQTAKIYQKLFKNVYVRAVVGGLVILVLTYFIGNQNYNGTGTAMIAACVDGEIHSIEFLLKIIFTALTLACGFKGGEIVPTFYIGAAFGCLCGNLMGFSPSLCAAIGMGAMFCGVTNCPITSLLICFELFGIEAFPFFLLAVGFSYAVSGYYGLYSSQKIVYSKYKSNFIDKKVR